MTPMLERINGPEDLKDLSFEELEELAEEIRAFVVDAVEKIGSGHLGSNLGAVELTIALHRVFESPEDIVLWDTGHQAYVHKILTGRQSRFDELRQEGGLSGYPSREESDHDWIENSHASTVLSYAHGLSTAQQSDDGDGRRVIAVIGDGSMTGGMAFEGLNNFGHSGRPAIIILNDNGRSYAPTISRLGDSLARLRLNPTYLRQQARLEKAINRVPLVGDRLERGFDATKAAVREMWEPPAFFEQLGVRYSGPFDGHDIEGVERALRHAAELDDGPVVVHVITKKGKGHPPAEDDPIKHMHDIGGIKPDSCAAAFTEALIKMADEHPEVVALTAAMPDSTGLLPFEERFPDRCFDVGIAEQHAVTSATGMAMGGLRPVFAVYSTFLTRAIDQVVYDAGLHRQPVVFCMDRSGITGTDGPSHHGILDMVLLRKVPGITMFAPSSYQEVGVMLQDAIELCTDGPASIRWPKVLPAAGGPDEVGSGLAARRVREGSDVCLVGVGKMLAAATEAAELLAADGTEATVWDPRVIKPFDPDLLDDAGRHPAVVIVEDGLRDGGVGMALLDELRETHLGSAPAGRALGVPDAYLPHGKPEAILARIGLDGPGVAASTRDLLATL